MQVQFYQGAISLVADTNMPEPNEEVTVYVQTDTPLLGMGIVIYVVGDANFTAAMCEADCNEYGWDNGWNSDPYFEDNWVYISGVRWDADANGTIGYFKFRYNSGQVIVYIDQENSEAFSFDWESQTGFPVPFSTDTLVFGQPDPNDSNQESLSSRDTITDENIPATAEEPNLSAEANDVNLPLSSYWQNKQAERQRHLMRCPASSDSNRETFNKADWEEQFQYEKNGGGQMLMDSEPNVIEINSDITNTSHFIT